MASQFILPRAAYLHAVTLKKLQEKVANAQVDCRKLRKTDF